MSGAKLLAHFHLTMKSAFLDPTERLGHPLNSFGTGGSPSAQ
jgi:hypothetical protein